MTEQELTNFLRAEGKLFGVTWLSKHCELTIGGIAGFLYSRHNGTTMRTALCLLHAMGYDLELKKVAKAPEKNSNFANKLPKETSTYSDAMCPKCGHDDGVITVHGHDQCAHCGHILVDCCGD